ncbi:O-methyltransferase, partial [Campylobacter jejuni]
LNLHKINDNHIEALREYAVNQQVPIVDRNTLEMIKKIIRINHTTRILEIGTAIGYSAMQFASVSDDIQVTTIERNSEMIQQAKSNISNMHYSHRIRLIEGDALEQFDKIKDQTFDMLFIDAAKAQSKKFFELFTPLLREGGIVITDNVLYHGFVSDIDIVR